MTTANTKVTATKAVAQVVTPKQEIEEKRIRDTDNTVLWTVIGLQSCEWTTKTVELLKEHKEQYKLVYINAEWQRRLVVEFNCRRSPAIFKGSMYFGSFDALEAYYKCSFFSDQELI